VSHVLDSNAIIILIKRLGEEAADLLKDNITASLALYELGNIIWKECNLNRSLSAEEAVRKMRATAILLDLMEVQVVDPADTMNIATKHNLTFYDASYLSLTRVSGKPLVTEDRRLTDKARQEGLTALEVDDFVNQQRM